LKSQELKERTKRFAHRCVKLAAALPDTELGRMIRGQLMRCSTSVASNYRATCIAQTKAVFTAKISTVFEEADECVFWLEFVVEERLIAASLVEPLLGEARELADIFGASRRTAQRNQGKKGAS
jgi:four helix bundle protein